MRKYLIVTIIVAAAAVLAAVYARPRLSKIQDIICNSHTDFLFSQLKHHYAAHLGAHRPPVDSAAAFVLLLSRWHIDWNSCSFHNDTIHDGWGRPVRVEVDANSVRLQSRGLDGQDDTKDDISTMFQRERSAVDA